MSLIRTVGRGAFYQSMGGVLQTVVRLVASMFLARRLDASDYGIFGMALMVYGVFDLLSASGVTSALIVKTDADREDMSTCFWSLIGVRSMICLTLIASAPLIAGFMNNERLTDIVRVVSLLSLITGMGAVSQAILQKKLRFGRISGTRFFGTLIESGLAVVLVASTDLRYWALVISMLISNVFITGCYCWSAAWVPDLTFNSKRYAYLMKFGINSTGSSLTSYLSNNFDYFIVGKLLGAKILGYYEFAYRIPHMINEKITGPAVSVVFPALAKNIGEDSKIADGFVKATKYIAWVVFPVFAGLALLAPSIVSIMWGQKWLVIVTPLRILCISAAINSVTELAKSVFFCKERPDLSFKFDLCTLLITIVCVSTLGYIFGLNGIAAGMVVVKLFRFASCYAAMRLVSGSFASFVATLFRPLLASAVMAFFVFYGAEFSARFSLNQILHLTAMTMIGCLIYMLFVRIVYKNDFSEIMHVGRTILSR